MMPRPHLSHRWRFLLLAGLLVHAPRAAAQQPPFPASHLPPNVRRWLAEATRDSALTPSQRETMKRLLRGMDPQRLKGPFGSPQAQAAAGQADGNWLELLPSGRSGHTAIYDPVRDRMVVFGGLTETYGLTNDVWALSLTGSPTWSTPAVPQPVGRFGHTAIYDPVRDRMIVFGGTTSGANVLNDVWALSLGDTPAWTELTPAGTPPSGRREHTAIYDPALDRMVVFGGTTGDASSLNDVWALSLGGTPTWSQLAPNGTPPSPRSEQTAIYDPVRNRMVVFGGVDSSNLYDDVWALSLGDTPTWSQLAPVGTPPSQRAGHAAIYDPVRDRMVVFGGAQGGDPKYANDVWALSLTGTPAWGDLTPPGTPPSVHWAHTAIYDSVRDRMIVFGGIQDLGNLPNEVWALSLPGSPEWSPVVSQPAGRFAHTAIYDPVRYRMIVFGGFLAAWEGGGNIVWALSLGETPRWTQITPAGPQPTGRAGHTAIYDPVRDRMVVFGGWGAGSDVWALSLGGSPTWILLNPLGSPPPELAGHTAIYDPLRDRMVVFGGGSNEVWALSLGGTPTWTQIVPEGPQPSGGSAAIYDPVRDRMAVVFGDWSDPHDAVWTLSLSGNPAWSQLTTSGTPAGSGPERGMHTAIYDPVRDRMVGAWPSGPDEVWALSLSGSPAWSWLTPAGLLPYGREYFTAIYDPVRDRMIVFGGVWQHMFGSDAWALEWGAPVSAVQDVPGTLHLGAPRPNPSRGELSVDFELEEPARVVLDLFDTHGRRVKQIANGWFTAGRHASTWRGDDDQGHTLGSGVYFIRVQGGGLHAVRRAVLVR